jgi:drug/metabolite transporter (DMT)-like permease
MNIRGVFAALLIALGFSSWPIIGSNSGICGGWVGTIVMTSTTLTVVLLSMRQMGSVSVPGIKPVILLFVAGIINGLALQVYAMMATDKSISTPFFVATVSIMMVVIAPFLNWLIKGEIPNFNQATGLVFAGIAIYFLNK